MIMFTHLQISNWSHHRIAQVGTSGGHLTQPSMQSRSSYSRFIKDLPSRDPNISVSQPLWGLDSMLGKPHVTHFYSFSKQNFPHFSLCFLPLMQTPCTFEERSSILSTASKAAAVIAISSPFSPLLLRLSKPSSLRLFVHHMLQPHNNAGGPSLG